MLEIDVETMPDAVVVQPKGDIDASRSRELQATLKDVFQSSPPRVVVDLGAVPYMDSSGLATLVEGLSLSQSSGTSFIVCALQERVRSIFEISRLDKVFVLADDVGAARSLGA